MSSIYYWKEILPSDWEVVPLKAVASYSVSSVDKVIKEEELPVELCNYTDVYKNDFITNDLEFMKGSATEEEILKYKVEIGDVIITKDSESWDDIAIPALVKETKNNLVCGYHLSIIKAYVDKILPTYLFYCLQSKDIRIQLELASTGVTRFGLPKDEIGRASLPLPDIDLQGRIANYIDNELAEITMLIKAKNNLLQALSEKRQALITQAVTKGINQKVKFKDSGINWLGEIPEHWVVKKLKYISNLKSGEFITSESIREDGLFPVYGGNGLRGYTSDKTHEGHLVLIGRQGALCGNINYASGEFWASEHAIVCNPLTDYNVTWLGELLRIMNLNQYSIAAAQPGLSVDVIKNLHIPVPSIKEQNEISFFINNETASIDKIYSVTEKTIELLKERRSTIITAAVTGQIQISS